MYKLSTILFICSIVALAGAYQIKQSNKFLNAIKPDQQNLIHIGLSKLESSFYQKKQFFDFIQKSQKVMHSAKQHQKKLSFSKLNLVQLYNGNDLNVEDENDEPSSIFAPDANLAQTSTSMIKEIQMINIKNTQYVGKISLSNQDNEFAVIFDTGSANFWINSKQCQDPGCVNHKQYDHAKSAQYQDKGLQLNVQFGTGQLGGQISADTAYLGGVKIENQNFAEITREVGSVFVQSKFDGIVGLAFSEMAAYKLNPVFDNIMAQKRLDNNMFSFFLSRKAGEESSKLILGGVDHTAYTGELNWHKVVDQYYWTIRADNILVGGKDVGACSGGCNVIADTGTSLLTGPSNDLQTLLSSINVDNVCNKLEQLPDITFVISGIHYSLQPQEYIMTMTDKGADEPFEHSVDANNCAGAFMPLDVPEPHGPAWILGDIFLSKFYTVFDRDNQRVGFAKAVVEEF